MASYADEVAALRGTRPATLKDLLTHPSFSRLAMAMTVSAIGDWVGFVAVASLVARLGGSEGAGYAVAGVMIARMLPSILLGPVAGVIVDRLDRKKLMIVADVARGVMYASMPFLIGQLWAIYVLSFFIETLALVWTPARDSSLPNMVPRRQLVNANTVVVATTYGTLPLGGILFTLLAGLALGLSDRGVTYFGRNPESLALWLDAGTFAFSALMVSRLSMKSPPSSGDRLDVSRVGRDIVEGIQFLRGHALARAMTIGILMAFAAVGAVLAVGPVFARLTLDAGAAGWGFLVTAIGIGMGLGMASVAPVGKFVEREFIFPYAMLGASVALIIVAAMPNISLAALMTAFLGAFVGTTWVTGYSLLQENVADEFRGRTFATLTVLGRLGLFVSLAAFPVLAEVVGDHALNLGDHRLDLSGTRLALWVAAAVGMAGALFSRRAMRRHHLTRPKPLTLLPRLAKGPRPGIFVVFEGVEGSGKGTQIRMAREYLESEGFSVLVTREPGGTELGEHLRELLLDPQTGTVEPRTEALLFAASRSQHVTAVIRPALQEGKVVLCDRYVDSSLAYQGVARGLGEQDVLTLNVWATQGLFPDLVVLLHLEPEAGLARNEEGPDRIESEGAAFHAKVSDAYLRIAEEHPERFVVVDAGRSPEEVHAEVREALERLLPERIVPEPAREEMQAADVVPEPGALPDRTVELDPAAAVEQDAKAGSEPDVDGEAQREPDAERRT